MPRCKQQQPVVPECQGPFHWGYTYVFYAAEPMDRSECEDVLYKYLDERSQGVPEFKAAVWQHFDDPDPCGKHNVVGDHYHVVTTKQVPEQGEAAFTPSSSAFGCWIRRYRKSLQDEKSVGAMAKRPGSGRWLEGPDGQSIFKPSGLFRYLRRPPRSLSFYTQNAEEFVFEKGDNQYLNHFPVVPGEPLPEVPGLEEMGSSKGGVFNPANATTKSGECLFGLMSYIGRSHATTIEQFQAWVLSLAPNEASHILEKYVSRTNFNQTFQKALEWYSADHASKEWRLQLGSIMKPAGVKFMSVERSLEMFNIICRWNHFDRMQLIEDCINLCEKTNQKVNTLLFVGTSNAGKSQVAQSLALTFSKVARLYQGQQNNFIFQSALGKGVCLHQEALFAKASYETFKLVMEGALTEVAVKGKPNATLPRVPYIITCNVLPWNQADPADARAFENRCMRYEFAYCPDLKDFARDGDMNPEMWQVLVKEWDEYQSELASLVCHEVMPVETRAEKRKQPSGEPTMTPEQHAELSADIEGAELFTNEYTAEVHDTGVRLKRKRNK